MADNVENMTLELLKRLQASIDRVERVINEHTGRLANLEGGQASIIQHLGHLAGADAAQQLSLDNVHRRLDRVERCLELND